jgi:hypothetical protein
VARTLLSAAFSSSATKKTQASYQGIALATPKVLRNQMPL